LGHYFLQVSSRYGQKPVATFLSKTVEPQGGTQLEYSVDGLNRHTSKETNGAWDAFQVNKKGLNPIAELDAAGSGLRLRLPPQALCPFPRSRARFHTVFTQLLGYSQKGLVGNFL